MASSQDGMQISPTYTFKNPRRQQYSFLYPFTDYIFKNNTAQAYANLIQTCKQFFGQKRVLVVNQIENDGFEMFACFGGKNISFFMEKLEKHGSKLWITRSLNCDDFLVGGIKISHFLKFLYRFDGIKVALRKQQLSYDEYMLFATSKKLEDLRLTDCIVKYSNGSLLTTETLLKPLLNLDCLL